MRKSTVTLLIGTRPEKERHTTTLACTPTHHIKNTGVVCCMPKTLYGVLPHLFLIHSILTLLITLFTITLIKSSVYLYSMFYLCLFFHKVTFIFLFIHLFIFLLTAMTFYRSNINHQFWMVEHFSLLSYFMETKVYHIYIFQMGNIHFNIRSLQNRVSW